MVNKKYRGQTMFAEMNNVPYVDLNRIDILDEIGFDGATDFYDKGHVNVDGAMKMSDYVGKCLQENFGLEDKRNLPGYEEWDALAENYYKEVYEVDWEEQENGADVKEGA